MDQQPGSPQGGVQAPQYFPAQACAPVFPHAVSLCPPLLLQYAPAQACAPVLPHAVPLCPPFVPLSPHQQTYFPPFWDPAPDLAFLFGNAPSLAPTKASPTIAPPKASPTLEPGARTPEEEEEYKKAFPLPGEVLKKAGAHAKIISVEAVVDESLQKIVYEASAHEDAEGSHRVVHESPRGPPDAGHRGAPGGGHCGAPEGPHGHENLLALGKIPKELAFILLLRDQCTQWLFPLAFAYENRGGTAVNPVLISLQSFRPGPLPPFPCAVVDALVRPPPPTWTYYGVCPPPGPSIESLATPAGKLWVEVKTPAEVGAGTLYTGPCQFGSGFEVPQEIYLEKELTRVSKPLPRKLLEKILELNYRSPYVYEAILRVTENCPGKGGKYCCARLIDVEHGHWLGKRGLCVGCSYALQKLVEEEKPCPGCKGKCYFNFETMQLAPMCKNCHQQKPASHHRKRAGGRTKGKNEKARTNGGRKDGSAPGKAGKTDKVGKADEARKKRDCTCFA